MATILTKRSNTASSVPVAGDLTNSASGAELAVNTADKRLFVKDSGGTVQELGTNPSTFSLPNGTANGVPYLNGSKVLTTGSALTFDGSSLGVGMSPAGSLGTSMRLFVNGASGGGIESFYNNLGGFALVPPSTGAGMIFYTFTGGVGSESYSEQMRLTSTGLGIGTSSPPSKLTAYQGSAQSPATSGNMNTGFMFGQGLTDPILNFGTDADGVWYNAAYGNNAGIGRVHRWLTGGTERMRLDTSGNLGLGVTPSAWGSTYRAIQLPSSTYGGGSFLTDAGSPAIAANAYNNAGWKYVNNDFATIYQSRSGQHQWFTAPSGTAGNAISFTQAMTLDSSGNLLVGTTSTNGRLTVVGTSGAQTMGVQVGANGNNGIGFNNASGTAVGSISVNASTVAYNTSSDYRLKEDIQPMTGALAKVAALKPCTYKWKADGSDGQGFIAHELAEVCPDAVTGTKDAVDAEGKPVYQGIDVSFLVGTLTAAIQELKAIVDVQAVEIAALKSK